MRYDKAPAVAWLHDTAAVEYQGKILRYHWGQNPQIAIDSGVMKFFEHRYRFVGDIRDNKICSLWAKRNK